MFADLPAMGFITVDGADAAKFLQGQLTCNIEQLSASAPLLGAYCSHQGRVQATFRIYRAGSRFYLLMPAEIIENTLSLLQKYAVFSKVTLTAADLRSVEISDPNLAHLNHCSLSQWKRFNIEALFPQIYLATKDKFTPHMLNLPQLGAVSFDKGCYIGQEIIARTHYRGQAKQHLCQIELHTPTLPLPGDTLFGSAQEPIGVIIDAVELQPQHYAALAVKKTI